MFEPLSNMLLSRSAFCLPCHSNSVLFSIWVIFFEQILVQFDASSADSRASDRSVRDDVDVDDDYVSDAGEKSGDGPNVADHSHLRQQIQAPGRKLEATSRELPGSGNRVHASNEGSLRPVVGLGQGIPHPEASENRASSKDHQVKKFGLLFFVIVAMKIIKDHWYDFCCDYRDINMKRTML